MDKNETGNPVVEEAEATEEAKATETYGYRVGYQCPPRSTRFRPGVSGNPAGRRKGSTSLASVLQKVALRRITIIEHGQRRSVTMMEAVGQQLFNQAVTGDKAAIRLLGTLMEDNSRQAEASVAPWSHEADEAVRKKLLEKLTAGILSSAGEESS